MMRNTAKRIYKPIADSFIRYKRNHPALQSRIVIPFREAIARTAPQLRMKNVELRPLATSASAFAASALKKMVNILGALLYGTFCMSFMANLYACYSCAKLSGKVSDFGDRLTMFEEQFRAFERTNDLHGDIKKMLRESKKQRDGYTTKAYNPSLRRSS
uniref:Col_cuticle_N domain-containing protein n=1 Tax=Steinernema glaseri TaxID=37863 RepID=A0A1I8AFM4_9BILA